MVQLDREVLVSRVGCDLAAEAVDVEPRQHATVADDHHRDAAEADGQADEPFLVVVLGQLGHRRDFTSLA